MWLYQFLFIDQNTKTLSHTKFWSQIGYGVMVWAFVYAVIFGSEADTMLWAFFGVTVVGNRTLKKWLLKNE